MSRDGMTAGEIQSTLIASFMTPAAYPHTVDDIELIETHISWVLLTGEYAYKIKKAVNLGFLDFSSLKKRRYFCDEELRLNRRFAPDLYLEVVPISGSAENPTLGGDGTPIEYAVKMRQFPQSAQLDNQLNAGLLHERDVFALAETVAAYHDRATVIEYSNDSESVRKVKAPMLENFRPVSQAIDMELLEHVHAWTTGRLVALKPKLIQRRRDGFVRNCHGDLHLKNLVRLDGGIAPFDCVEFSTELRNIDVISDIAFLVMDLVAHARQDLAWVFLNRYLECTGDYRGMELFGLYFIYHCMIRAKVAAIRSAEPRDEEDRGDKDRNDNIDSLKHHLAVAARWIDSPRPMLIAMHGFSASGKTWLSSRLLSQLPAIRIRSDIERKRLLGLGEQAASHSKPGSGIYSSAGRTRVYDALYELAGHLLEAGSSVIVDASFLKRADRMRFAALASGIGLPFMIVHTKAGSASLAERLRARSESDERVSEADEGVLEYQQIHSDALNASERKFTIDVNTDQRVDVDVVIKQLRAAR